MRFRPSRVFAALARLVCRAALRVLVTGLIFAACLLAGLSYMGVPPPDLHELMESFGSVARLADVLS